MNFVASGVLGAVLIVAWSALRPRDRETLPDLGVAAGLLAAMFLLAGPVYQSLQSGARPTYDRLLYHMDLGLGLDPQVLIHSVNSIIALHCALAFVYYSLPLAFAVVWTRQHPSGLLSAVVLAPVLAFACYHLAPAVGPAHVGDPLAPINCFPSLHVTWALLLARASRGTVLRPLLWLFAEFTALATVGLGEHYFVDLIAAVPFCVAVEALAELRFSFSRREELNAASH